MLSSFFYCDLLSVFISRSAYKCLDTLAKHAMPPLKTNKDGRKKKQKIKAVKFELKSIRIAKIF